MVVRKLLSTLRRPWSVRSSLVPRKLLSSLRPTWFVCDGCGIVCMSMAYGFLSAANVIVVRLGRWPSMVGDKACVIIYETWFGLALWAHLACMLTDPGTVPTGVAPEEGTKQCTKCNAPKPPRAHHCSICKRCVMKMDHHCPWVNNCVGAKNQKHFMLFLVYVHLQCWGALLSLGSHFLHAIDLEQHPRPRAFLGTEDYSVEAVKADAQRRAAEKVEAVWDTLCCMLIFFIAVIFGLFTFIMLCDQLSRVLSNQTGIEQLQGAQYKARPWRELLQEVMGRGPSWRWVIPTPLGQVEHET